MGLALIRAVDDERDLAALRPQSLEAAEQHAERRRVDERGLGEVDDDATRAGADQAEQLALEMRRRVEVALAGNRDETDTVVQPLALDPDLHALLEAAPFPRPQGSKHSG